MDHEVLFFLSTVSYLHIIYYRAASSLAAPFNQTKGNHQGRTLHDKKVLY